MTQMPLNDRDFAEIRANVMREIERRRTRNVWVAGAAFAFAVLALVFVLIPREPARNAERGARSLEKQVAASSPLPAPRSQLRAPSSTPTIVATKTPPKKHHHHRHPQPQTAVASAEPLTIELQTANPDIRIIWIAK